MTVGQTFVFPPFRRRVSYVQPSKVELTPAAIEPAFIWRLDLQDSMGNSVKQLTTWAQPLSAMTESAVLQLAKSIACREAGVVRAFRRVVATAKQTSAWCTPSV